MAQALKFTTTCDDTQFEQAMRRIQRAALQASDRVSAGFARAGSSLARTALAAVSIYEGIRVGKFLADGIKQAYDFGAEIDRISKRTGLFAEQVAILQKASRTAGIENLAQSVNKMQRSLEEATTDATGPAAKAFRDLGLNAASLIRQLPADQLQAVGQAINGIADPTRKAADAIAIFGRAGAELIPFFQNTGAIGNAMTALGRQARILGDNAATFRRVSELLQDAGIKIQGFFVGAAAEISGKLLPFLERLDRVDLAGIGRQFGDGLIKGVNYLVGAFASPQTLFGAMEDYLKAAFLGAGNVLIHGVQVALNLATDPEAWARLANIFTGYGQILQGALTKAFIYATSYLVGGIQMALDLLPGSAKSKAKDRQQEILAQEDVERENFNKAPKGSEAQTFARAALIGLIKDYADQQKIIDGGGSLSDHAKAVRDGSGAMGEVINSANQEIADGKATLKSSVGTFFDSVSTAVKSTPFTDYLGAGNAMADANTKAAQMQQIGKRVVDNNTKPQARLMGIPGYPQGKPVDDATVAQKRRDMGYFAANRLLFNEGEAESLNNDRQPVRSAAAKAQDIALFGSYQAKQILTDKGQLKADFDPSVNPNAAKERSTFLATGTNPYAAAAAMGEPSVTATAGVGTGAVPSKGVAIGSSGYLTPYAKMRERSIAPFANGTSLTTGGLGGGAYGATGNIWHQISGYGLGGPKKDPAEETAKNTADLAKKMDQYWGPGGGGGTTGGGATSTK